MKPGPSVLRVMIVDAEPAARRGLRMLLEEQPGYIVSAVVGSVAEAREEWRRRPSAVVLLDVADASGESLKFIADCVRRRPATAVVVHTMREDAESVRRALEAGARGYVSRQDAEPELLRALTEAVAGQRHMGPRIEHRFLDGVAAGRAGGAPLREKLSPREWEVFTLLAAGGTAREIAERLGCSPKTVETHLRRLREKLKAASLRDLQRMAILSATPGIAAA